MFCLTLSQTSPSFLCVCSISLLETLWETEELLKTSNFSFSHSVFYLFEEISIFINVKIAVCKLLEFKKSLKFVVWERVQHTLTINPIYDIPSSEILEFPSVINFDIITSDNINFHFHFLS